MWNYSWKHYQSLSKMHCYNLRQSSSDKFYRNQTSSSRSHAAIRSSNLLSSYNLVMFLRMVLHLVYRLLFYTFKSTIYLLDFLFLFILIREIIEDPFQHLAYFIRFLHFSYLSYSIYKLIRQIFNYTNLTRFDIAILYSCSSYVHSK